MKNLILLFVFLFAASCKRAEMKPVVIEKPVETVKIDTVVIRLTDTVYVVKSDDSARLLRSVDSLKTANNKLGKELLHNKLIIQNARYYLNIANKNPSQQKFLRGWMNRALNQ